MIEVWFRLFVTAVIVFSGVFLRLVQWGSAGKFVNLFWEIIYGLGFLMVGFLPGGIESRPAILFGALIWPICISIGVFMISGTVWHIESLRLRTILGVGLIVSLLCVITLDRAYQPPFDRFPLFRHFLFVLY